MCKILLCREAPCAAALPARSTDVVDGLTAEAASAGARGPSCAPSQMSLENSTGIVVSMAPRGT